MADSDGWQTHTDPSSGNQYEYNASTGETRWLSSQGGDAALNGTDHSGSAGESGIANPDENDDDEKEDMSVEEQLAAEEKMKKERLEAALRQMEPSRGLSAEAFAEAKTAAGEGTAEGDARATLEAVLRQHPQVRTYVLLRARTCVV